MPYSLAVFVPPTGLNREYTRCYGFEMEDIFAFGMKSVLTKWRAIGYPMEDMPGVFPVDHSLEPEEIASRQIRLLESRVMGEPHPNPDTSPEVRASTSTSSPAPPIRTRPTASRSRSSGTSTTPIRGTSSSQTARPGPSREWRPPPT